MEKRRVVCNSKSKKTYLLSRKNFEKFAGKYVCVAHFDSKNIISANRDPALAYQAAQKNGYSDPVTFYVPRKGEIFIFSKNAKN